MSKKILIVDDMPMNIHIIADFLKENDESYKIMKAISGSVALELTIRNIPDLIITDWYMPEMNGMELVKKLKDNELTSDIPIIICTAVMTNPKDLFEAFEKGVDDFIRKPVDKLELNARVKSILKIQDYHNQAILHKNNEIALHVTSIMQKEEQNAYIIKNLDLLLKKIDANSNDSEDVRALLVSILNEVNIIEKINKHHDISSYLNQIHPNFTRRLTKKYPNLTPSNIRMCILLKMNMDSKTIASILFKTEGSIKTARKRLRAKLSLNRKENLVSFVYRI